MLTADLVQTFTPDFVVHNDVLKLCGCPNVAVVLSKFIWWSRVTERKYPDRCGWFYKTHLDFLNEFCLKRRGYEKAREILVNQLGVLEYRRAGFFGRMHWRINAEKLQAALCRIRGSKPAPVESNFQQDRDGFWLPKSIPLTQWHYYLDSRTKHNGRLIQATRTKRRWVKQLEKLIKECADIGAFMVYAADKDWNSLVMFPSVKWDDVLASANKATPIPTLVEEEKPPLPPSPPIDVDKIRNSFSKKFNYTIKPKA